MSFSSKARQTEIGRHLESFLDTFKHSDFAEGYESLMSSLDKLNDEIDKDADGLEMHIARLEEQIVELENRIEELEEDK